MNKNNFSIAEYLVGSVVIIITLTLCIVAILRTYSSGKHYIIYTEFTSVDGLYIGAPIKISGVTIGNVLNIELGENYLPKVTLSIKQSIKLTINTTAGITGDLFGTKYVDLTVMSLDESNVTLLKDQDIIEGNGGSFSLEKTVSAIITKLGSSSGKQQ